MTKNEYDRLTKPQRIVNVPLTDFNAALSPAPSPTSKDMSKPKRVKGLVNPSVHVLIEYLRAAFEKHFQCEPVMNYPGIAKQLKILLERDRFSEDALRELIDWFLASPKAVDHPTPAAAISADTVQRWQIACPENNTGGAE